MQFSLVLINREPEPGDIPAEVMEEFQSAFTAYVQSLEAAGVFVSADILQPSSASTTVTVRDGAVQIQDGPFADTKEQLSGTFVVNVADLDEALEWAQKCPGARFGSVEVRPSALTYRDGQWIGAH